MAWVVPKTNWLSTDGVSTTDLNRIEGNTDDLNTRLTSHVGSGDTAHAEVTTTTDGFMIAADKSKLDGIQAGAQVNAVNSVNGKTGTISLASGDVNAVDSSNLPHLTIGRGIIASSTDLNNLTEPGTWLLGDSTTYTNSPPISWGVLEVFETTPAGGGYLTQRVTSVNTGSIFQRARNDQGVWTLWSNVLTASSILPFFDKMTASGADGDVTISADTTAPKNIMYYHNLTINAGTTLFVKGPGINLICVSGTLTLNGKISAERVIAGGNTNGGGAGVGGYGGGILIVAANKVVGTGTISASGQDGGNGVSVAYVGGVNYRTGNDGTSGSFLGQTITGGKGGNMNAQQAGGVAPGPLYQLLEYFIANLIKGNYTSDTGAAGGGGGSASGQSSYSYSAAGGGGGFIAAGGAGGYNSSTLWAQSSTFACGGGGGGGGFCMVYSPNALPAITISANGGKGGNSANNGYGGGGGGGGYALAIAPSVYATVQASGGAAGTSVDGTTAAAGNGGAGYARVVGI